MESLKELLGIHAQQEQPQPKPNQRQTNETYQQWGHRMAGFAMGSEPSFDPCMQIVYQNIRREQSEDQKLQEKLQLDLQTEIVQHETQLEKQKNEEEHTRKKIENTESEIKGKKNELTALNAQGKRKNGMAVTNLVIGLMILIPLTVYLFIFYSSTAYSAFFKVIDYTEDISQHMFDGQALMKAWDTSWTEGLFILLLPFIFLALGFVLHQFGKQDDKAWAKLMKQTGIISVTFIFDCLLAYAIAKRMYDAEILTEIGDFPPFSPDMAVTSGNFWMVICCGFLAYLIWGLLFGFVMENIENLDLNKVERKALKRQIAELEQQNMENRQKQIEQQGQIKQTEGEIKKLQKQQIDYVRYDTHQILLELNQFLSGWQNYMSVAGRTDAERKRIQEKFNAFCATVNA
ncbi:MAG: hypothetical protein IJ680_02420 [Paludibacteraceae bacterium]|nr:hypothetical protein [Paludibacteraceae bacterium]